MSLTAISILLKSSESNMNTWISTKKTYCLTNAVLYVHYTYLIIELKWLVQFVFMFLY